MHVPGKADMKDADARTHPRRRTASPRSRHDPVTAMTRSALLLLADSRFPAGVHAHSGGLEAAAAAGRVHDAPSLHAFLEGRLHTGGLLAAAFAAAACQADSAETLAELDHEHDVRLVSPALRQASRRLGRQLLRAAAAAWPSPRLELLAPLADGSAAAESAHATSDATAAADVDGPRHPHIPGSASKSADGPHHPHIPGSISESADGPHHPLVLGVV